MMFNCAKKKYASKGTRLRAMPFRFWCLSRSERERERDSFSELINQSMNIRNMM